MMNDEFNYRKAKLKPMTLIIGLKAQDWLVLIGDRKVTNGTDCPQYVDKIEAPVHGIRMAVGAAGLVELSKEFNRRIFDVVRRSMAEHHLANLRAFNGTGISFEDVENGKIRNVAIPFVYGEEYSARSSATISVYS